MKSKFFLLLCLSLGTAISINAQPGGLQRLTVPERVAMVHSKLDSAFQPGPDKLVLLDALFTDFYNALDAKRKELFAGGNPDMETFQAERKKQSESRDTKLKAILTETQYKIWKEKIEPAMRPQRPPGGGNG